MHYSDCQLKTTHFSDDGKPQTLCMLAKINGRLSLAYFKGDNVVSYIPWEDVGAQIYKARLPNFSLNF